MALLCNAAAGCRPCVGSIWPRRLPSAIPEVRPHETATSRMPGCRAWLAKQLTNQELIHASFCIGMVEGLHYVAPGLCPPLPTVDEMVRVVVQYIDARPERHHEKFKVLALEAMRKAWPCK